MEIELNAAQRKFQGELRSHFAEMMTEALTEELSESLEGGGGPEFRRAMHRMGRDGLLAHQLEGMGRWVAAQALPSA